MTNGTAQSRTVPWSALSFALAALMLLGTAAGFARMENNR